MNLSYNMEMILIKFKTIFVDKSIKTKFYLKILLRNLLFYI